MSKRNYAPVGGQALMEGIMMTGPKGTAVSLRLPDRTIETQMKVFKRLKNKYKIFGLPFIRGIVSMVESMVFGYKCLMESAEKTSFEEELDVEELSRTDRWLSDHFGPKMMAVIGGISMVLGLALAVILFMVLPTYIYTGIEYLAKTDLDLFQALIEGGIRILVFVAYLLIVSRMQDIRRVFMYHGAEHKSIFCYENGEELTVENVRKQKRFHPRCGTSMIFVTILISILVTALVALAFPEVQENRVAWIAMKILILPLIIGLGYESIQLAGKYDNILTKILSAPGLLMQRITTKEPDDDMIEVAIAAIKAALGMADEKETIVDEVLEKDPKQENVAHEVPKQTPQPQMTLPDTK